MSEKSVEDVKKTIELVKPHTVLLELCKGRTGLLSKQPESKKMTFTQFLEQAQKAGIFPTLLSYFYGLIGDKVFF